MKAQSTSPMLAAALLAVASASITNSQAASLVTSVAVGASSDPQSFPGFAPNGYNSSNSGARVSADGSETFTGLDRSDQEATMTFSGTATASADYGMLRTAASGSVSGVYSNANNPPYYYYEDYGDDNDESGNWIVDPDGSPTFLVSYGQAQFNDTLNYGTIPAGFTTDFWFHISGSFTGTNLTHSVYVEFGEQSDALILYPADGANHIWTTNKFVPLPGQDLNFSTTVVSQFNFYPENATDGESFSGSADFMNTVTLAAINVYDEDDNLVSGWAPTSGSGTAYAIPEPSAALLGLAGVLGFLVRRRSA